MADDQEKPKRYQRTKLSKFEVVFLNTTGNLSPSSDTTHGLANLHPSVYATSTSGKK